MNGEEKIEVDIRAECALCIDTTVEMTKAQFEALRAALGGINDASSKTIFMIAISTWCGTDFAETLEMSGAAVDFQIHNFEAIETVGKEE